MGIVIGVLVVILLVVAIVAISRSSRRTKMEVDKMASAQRLSQVQRPDFRISASELSVGDWIVDANGNRVQVVNFKRDDLVVKPEGGEPFRISPPFNFRKV